MSFNFERQSNRPQRQDKQSSKAVLKRCPVCRTLNTQSAPECASCGWQGAFEYDPDLLRKALKKIYGGAYETGENRDTDSDSLE